MVSHLPHRHPFHQLKPCRVRNVDTKEKIVEIAHFSRVTEAYQFTKNGPDFRNKEPISELDIRIAVRIAYE